MPGRLLYGDVPRDGTSRPGGGSRASNGAAADSTGWMVGLDRDTSRAWPGGGGGGYSGARCAAEDMRFLTLVNRPLDSEEGTGDGFAGLPSCVSEDPTEKRLDSRWLDFFLSPNIVGSSSYRLCRSGGGSADEVFRQVETLCVGCDMWFAM